MVDFGVGNMLVCSCINLLKFGPIFTEKLANLRVTKMVPHMGVSYPEFSTISSVTQLCIVVLFSCSSCIVSVLPFWCAGKLGKLSELNAENNVGS